MDTLKMYLNEIFADRYNSKKTGIYIGVPCAAFLIFAIVIICCSFSIYSYYTNKNEQRMIAQSCNTGDFIFREVNSLITKNIDSNITISQALYGNYEQENSSDYNKVANELNKLTSSSNIIESIYIVSFKQNTVYSSWMTPCKLDEFFDQNIITILKQNRNLSTFYFPHNISKALPSNAVDDYDVISCVYNNSEYGAIIANIDRTDFNNIVNLYNGQSNISSTIVITKTGDIISVSNPLNFKDNYDNIDIIISKILGLNNKSGYFSEKGMLINYMRSSYTDFGYIQLTQTKYIFRALLMLLVLVPLFLIFIIILSFILVIKLPRPHPEPAPAVPKPVYTNKFSYNFFSDNRSDLIRKLLFGTFTYSKDELSENGIIFDMKFFGVIMARIDRMKELDPAGIPIIKYGIMNIGNDVFSKFGRVYSIEPNEYDIAWIINYENPAAAVPGVKQVQEFVESIYKITVSFGCNFGADSAEDISDLYHNSMYSLSFRLSMGYNSIILYNSIKDYAKNICEYPEEIEKEIIYGILSNNRSIIHTCLDKFMDEIDTAPYSTILTHVNRLLSAADSIPNNETAEEQTTVNYLEIMTRMETITEIKDFVLHRFENLAIKLSDTKTDYRKNMIVDAVVDFIDEHYKDPNLSIDIIANAVNRSANYTRSIFKQIKGISISEYISNKRFDEVCRLLIETEQSAQEIGKQIGLNSGSYFYTAFKKHTGCTPDQYRKQHGSSQLPSQSEKGEPEDESST